MAGRFSIETVFKAVDRLTAPVSRMQNRVGRFTRSMEKGLRGVNRGVNNMLGGLRKGAGALMKFGGLAASAVAGLAVVAMNKAAAAADSLAKQSRRLQFPIEELQEWKFVADQSGIANSLMDSSLGAFSKRLGEARAGTGPLKAGLKKLNPELLKQLNATDSISDAFEIYMDAIRKAESATEKAALANAAFSRSGLALVNITDNSSAAIKALREEQRQNGNITKEQAEAAELYNDAVNSLKMSLIGMTNGILLPMLPVLTKTLRKWREWIVSNKELIKGKVLDFARDLKKRIISLADAAQEFSQKYNIGEIVTNSLDAIISFAEFIKGTGSTVLKTAAGIVGLVIVLKTLVGVLTLVNLVMLANPITLIILGIALLIAALASAVVWWDELKAAFMSLSGPAKSALLMLSGPLGSIAGAAVLVMDAWKPVGAFFSEMWGGVVRIFTSSTDSIMGIVNKVSGAVGKITGKAASVGSGVANFLGFGDEEAPRPQVASPQDRVARSIEERRTTSSAEVTIRDESGRAAVTGGNLGSGLKLKSSGGF